MSAPGLWVAVPLAAGALAVMLISERATAWTGGITCLVLCMVALWVPIDTPMLIGPFSFKVASSASLLGRSLVIPAAEGPLIALLYGICCMWFLGAEAAGVAKRLVPAGLVITALLVASMAVQPFLYAAPLIEIAVLAAVPVLAPQGQTPGRSVIKFLTYQTLGMPCILLAGWLLAGVEASPGDLALTVQATIMLSLGFAFLLAIFPLHDWIPALAGETQPYLAGFLLWLLPTAILVFGLSFLDRYAWLRGSTQVVNGLRILGLVMLVTAGIWASIEKNLGRILGQAIIAENGLALLATSLAVANGKDPIFPFFIPRGVAMAVWALSLGILYRSYSRLDIDILRSAGRTHPWTGAALTLAALSTAGFPLLAGFPPRIDVWNGLASLGSSAAVWYLVGLAGLMIGAVRQVTLVVGAPRDVGDLPQETPLQKAMLGTGMAGLIVLGIFPRAVDFIVLRLPLLFEHLAR